MAEYQTKNYHLFHTCGKRYLYDMNKNVILSVNDRVYNALRKNSSHDCENNVTLNKLIAEGFLSDSKIESLKHPMTDILSDYLNNNIRMLTLQVTQNCNLRCKYCTYSGTYINRTHTNKRMSFETAKRAIDFYIKHSKQTSELRFAFYGGEPLLEFGLIEKCVEYIKSNVSKHTHYSLTTNATIFSDEILDFLDENAFSLTISLDGSKEIQNRNRVYADNSKGTFDTVLENVVHLRNKHPKLLENMQFNAVVDPVDGYQQSSDFFTHDERVNGVIVSVSEKNELNYLGTYEKDYAYYENRSYENFKHIMKHFNRYSGKTSPLVNMYLSLVKAKMADKLNKGEIISAQGHPGGPCIPGGQRLFVNVDGNFYPCERVNESAEIMKIGNVDIGFDIQKVSQMMNVGKITENICKNCWTFRFCTSCIAHAEENGVLSSEKRLSNCDRIKNSVENMMKEYCILKNLKFDFDGIEELQEVF